MLRECLRERLEHEWQVGEVHALTFQEAPLFAFSECDEGRYVHLLEAPDLWYLRGAPGHGLGDDAAQRCEGDGLLIGAGLYGGGGPSGGGGWSGRRCGGALLDVPLHILPRDAAVHARSRDLCQVNAMLCGQPAHHG